MLPKRNKSKRNFNDGLSKAKKPKISAKPKKISQFSQSDNEKVPKMESVENESLAEDKKIEKNDLEKCNGKNHEQNSTHGLIQIEEKLSSLENGRSLDFNPGVTTMEESFSSWNEQKKCKIRNVINDFEWGGGRILNCRKGGSHFVFWRLFNDVNFKEYFYFGVEMRGKTRYVTFNGNKKAFILKPSDVHPNLVNFERGEEKNDPRAFFWKARRLGGGHLVLASDHNVAARLNKRNHQVIADDLDAFTDRWVIDPIHN